jgi:hypothetical protein
MKREVPLSSLVLIIPTVTESICAYICIALKMSGGANPFGDKIAAVHLPECSPVIVRNNECNQGCRALSCQCTPSSSSICTPRTMGCAAVDKHFGSQT